MSLLLRENENLCYYSRVKTLYTVFESKRFFPFPPVLCFGLDLIFVSWDFVRYENRFYEYEWLKIWNTPVPNEESTPAIQKGNLHVCGAEKKQNLLEASGTHLNVMCIVAGGRVVLLSELAVCLSPAAAESKVFQSDLFQNSFPFLQHGGGPLWSSRERERPSMDCSHSGSPSSTELVTKSKASADPVLRLPR